MRDWAPALAERRRRRSVPPGLACRRAIVKGNVSCTSDIKLTNDLETVLAGAAGCRAVPAAVVPRVITTSP